MNQISSSRRSAIFADFSAQMTLSLRSTATRAPGPSGVRVLLFAWGVLAASVGLSGCAEPVDPKAPKPTLAASIPAGEAMAALRNRWAHGTRDERVALRGYLGELRQRYGNEPIRRLLDLYDAWILLETGDPTGAEIAARRLRIAPALVGGLPSSPSSAVSGGAPTGNTDDLVLLVEGAALSRNGHPDRALDTLLPLLDKLLDPYARELLHEEALGAALTSHRWADAILVLEAYQRDIVAFSGDATLAEAADARIEAALKAIPGTALFGALQRYRDTERLDAPLARKLSARLAEIAVARGDTPLAQRLVQTQRQSDLATLGDQRQSLLELASAHVGARLVGHTIGLVLTTGDDEARLRAASLAFGATSGASETGVSGRAGVDRLPVARSEPASAAPLPGLLITTALLSTDPATLTLEKPTLRALLQRGTLVLVGGDTPAAAAQLARFADEHEVPALLLTAPSTPTAPAPESAALPSASSADEAGAAVNPWSVVIGPDDSGDRAVVASLEAQGATRIAALGDAAPSSRLPSAHEPPAPGGIAFRAPCPDLSLHVQGTYPFDEWERAGVTGILLGGSESCARRAIEELARRRKAGRWKPLVGFTLPSASLVGSLLAQRDAPTPPSSPRPHGVSSTAAALQTLAPFVTATWPWASFPKPSDGATSPIVSSTSARTAPTEVTAIGGDAGQRLAAGPAAKGATACGRKFEDIWSARARELFRTLRLALAPLPTTDSDDEATVRQRRREALRIIREVSSSNAGRNQVEATLIRSASIDSRGEWRGSSNAPRRKESKH
jgi:hypothetical protein